MIFTAEKASNDVCYRNLATRKKKVMEKLRKIKRALLDIIRLWDKIKSEIVREKNDV